MSDLSHERLLAKIADWSAAPRHDTDRPIRPELVHKHRPENVAVARLARFDPDRPDHYLAEILVDQKHPYFFEHEIDHVPALLLVEAVRQAGVAAAHLYYGIPLDTAMIVDDFEIAFERYAELDMPLYARVSADEKGYRGDRLASVRMSAELIQDGVTIGRSRWGCRLLWWAR